MNPEWLIVAFGLGLVAGIAATMPPRYRPRREYECLPGNCCYAYMVQVDGQQIRLEAPDLAGLRELIEGQEAEGSRRLAV